MFNVLQKSACMQSSATVCRTDTMYYCLLQAMYSSIAVKRRGSMHTWTTHCHKVGGSGPQDPHRIAATDSKVQNN